MTLSVSDCIDASGHYLDLLKNCLTRYIFPEQYRPYQVDQSRKLLRIIYPLIRKWLSSHQLVLVRTVSFDPLARFEGKDWPLEAETMIGLKRLNNLERCIADVLQKKVPGDFIETGVWRGGVTIFMRAMLKIYGDTERIVWAADSFQGLPKPDAMQYPPDEHDSLWTYDELKVSEEEVRANFARYGLLDDQVRFIKGWFRDTLSKAEIDKLAILRLDGDMYESTMDSLQALYPKLSRGGYVIIDDYGCVPGCRSAVDDFRQNNSVTEELHWIDWSGVFWKKML